MIAGVAESRTGHWYARMVARDTREAHRVATPLELLFDLCFAVAVARAAAQLHHDLSAGHVGQGMLGYVTVFFAIWWAWVNFTWFASAYDTDDAVYRLTTLIQISGALTVAASGLVVVFALWWTYFDRSAAARLDSLPWGIAWGYGHYLVFASAAAVGAGLTVAVDRVTGAPVGARLAGYAVAVPVAVYLLSVTFLHRVRRRGAVPVLVGA